MRGVDLDTAGSHSQNLWLYRPSAHKTEHLGRERLIEIGPRAQTVILDGQFLQGDPAAYLFAPPAGRGSRGGKDYRKKHRGGRSGRTMGKRYTPDSYRRAIARGCKAAGCDRWSPHQLRHAFATEVRRRFGIEAARIMLGHRSAVTTEIYAEADRQAARKAARAIG